MFPGAFRKSVPQVFIPNLPVQPERPQGPLCTRPHLSTRPVPLSALRRRLGRSRPQALEGRLPLRFALLPPPLPIPQALERLFDLLPGIQGRKLPHGRTQVAGSLVSLSLAC